jgi:hypothetical protein
MTKPARPNGTFENGRSQASLRAPARAVQRLRYADAAPSGWSGVASDAGGASMNWSSSMSHAASGFARIPPGTPRFSRYARGARGSGRSAADSDARISASSPRPGAAKAQRFST